VVVVAVDPARITPEVDEVGAPDVADVPAAPVVVAGVVASFGWAGGIAVVTTAVTVQIATITRKTMTLRDSRGTDAGRYR
jgi:hypothetical protein